MGPNQERRWRRRNPRLFLNHLADYDILIALEQGRVDDGQPHERWRSISDRIGYLYDDDADPKARSRCIGFKVVGFAGFDAQARRHARIWRGPRFDSPLLGIDNATAGELIVAARAHFDGSGSINRFFFDQALHLQGEEALPIWRACLEAGDSMAHFALGYTNLELGNDRLAYRHLRHYCELAPAQAWVWCWFGRAAEAIGETAEALEAYEIAIELSEEEDETNAPELLAELEERLEAGSRD